MIVKVPNPVLTSVSKPVAKIDKKILNIISQMKKTLVSADKPKGVGLAAPQIGIPLRIFIAKPEKESQIEVFINPQIIYKSEELAQLQRPAGDKSEKSDKKLEGCLSIPNIWGYLKRAKSLRLRFMDINGKLREKDYSGFMATIIQHEVDHLDGILFTQRILEQKQKLYKIETNDKGQEQLVELEI